MDPVVVLDPGHGGDDVGACHNGIVESVYTLAMANVLRHELALHKIGCIFTRDTDIDPSHIARAHVALSAHACGTISLHVNANADPREHGPTAFHRDDDVVGLQAAQAWIKALGRSGEYVDDGVVRPMKWQTHVVRPTAWKSRAWNCIIHQPLPVVLCEMEYCSHEPSAWWLLSSEGQDQLISALVSSALVMAG